MPPNEDLAHNPGMCPDWELNQQPFDLQARTQPLSHTSQVNWKYFLKSYFLNKYATEEQSITNKQFMATEKHRNSNGFSLGTYIFVIISRLSRSTNSGQQSNIPNLSFRFIVWVVSLWQQINSGITIIYLHGNIIVV